MSIQAIPDPSSLAQGSKREERIRAIATFRGTKGAKRSRAIDLKLWFTTQNGSRGEGKPSKVAMNQQSNLAAIENSYQNSVVR